MILETKGQPDMGEAIPELTGPAGDVYIKRQNHCLILSVQYLLLYVQDAF